MSDSSFPPETIDAQTGQHADGLSPADAHLVDDLHRVYEPLADGNARSLERVRARLAQQEARLLRSRSEPAPTSLFLQRLYSMEQTMKPSLTIHTPEGRWHRGISLLAAVLLLAILVGSMAAVFALVRHNSTGNNPNQQTNTPGISGGTETPGVTVTTTPEPEPTPTPGTYIISARTFYGAQVSKLDPQTRQPIWTQPIGAVGAALSSGSDVLGVVITPALVVYGDTVYAVSGDTDSSQYNNYVYAFNATTGELRWKVKVITDTFTSPQYGGPYDLGVLSRPTIAQGILYVAARDGKLFALDAATGTKRWEYDAPASSFVKGVLSDANPPVVEQGVVYNAVHNVLYALNASSGKQLWTKQIDQTLLFIGPTLSDGVLYLAARSMSQAAQGAPQSSSIYAYAEKDGRPLWGYTLKSWVLAPPTVANGMLYFGSYDQNLYALKASNGTERWHYNTGGMIFEQPLVEQGIVYIDELGTSGGISSDSTVLFAINATNGSRVWKKPVVNMLALEQVQDGVIYVGIWPGQLAALNVTDGSTLWQEQYGAKLIDKTNTESEMPPVVTVIS